MPEGLLGLHGFLCRGVDFRVQGCLKTPRRAVLLACLASTITDSAQFLTESAI